MWAVLFDVDGVLLDSYAGYREVWSRWCAARDIDIEVAWAATHGRRPVETVAEVAAHLDPQVEYEFLKELLASAGELFPPFPEAPALLRSLPPARWGVVTSGERKTVLGRFRLAEMPEPRVLVDGHDVTLGKPSPEGYLRAADLLAARPDSCLVVEDAPAGVAAGKAAGMTVLALATTHEAHDLMDADLHATSLGTAAATVRSWLDER